MASSFRANNARLNRYRDSLPDRSDKAAERIAQVWEKHTSERIVHVGAVDTGELRDSPRVEGAAKGRRRVVVGAAHGVFVNYGTWKMGARPFWEPAIEDTRDEMPSILKDEFKP